MALWPMADSGLVLPLNLIAGPMSCAATFDIAQQGIATSTAVSIAPEQVCTVDCRRVREKTVDLVSCC